MLELFSAFVATSYIFSVFFLSFCTVCAFDRPVIRELFAHSFRKYLSYVEVLSSGVTEVAVHLILLKLLIIKIVSFLGGFSM
jgi:hypothetical protein